MDTVADKVEQRGFSGRRTVIALLLGASLTLPGCARNGNDDMAGALLIGAAVVGLGVLAATADDDDNDSNRNRRHRFQHHDGYDRGYQRSGYETGRGRGGDSRYAGNGQCDDARYRTSNGGRAEAGSDEWDCRRFGDGRK